MALKLMLFAAEAEIVRGAGAVRDGTGVVVVGQAVPREGGDPRKTSAAVMVHVHGLPLCREVVGGATASSRPRSSTAMVISVEL